MKKPDLLAKVIFGCMVLVAIYCSWFIVFRPDLKEKPQIIDSPVDIPEVTFSDTFTITESNQPIELELSEGNLRLYDEWKDSEGWKIDKDGTMTYHEPEQEIEKPIVYYDDLLPVIWPEWMDEFDATMAVPFKLQITDEENNELGYFTLEVELEKRLKIVRISFEDTELFCFGIPIKNKEKKQ